MIFSPIGHNEGTSRVPIPGVEVNPSWQIQFQGKARKEIMRTKLGFQGTIGWNPGRS